MGPRRKPACASPQACLFSPLGCAANGSEARPYVWWKQMFLQPRQPQHEVPPPCPRARRARWRDPRPRRVERGKHNHPECAESLGANSPRFARAHAAGPHSYGPARGIRAGNRPALDQNGMSSSIAAEVRPAPAGAGRVSPPLERPMLGRSPPPPKLSPPSRPLPRLSSSVSSPR